MCSLETNETNGQDLRLLRFAESFHFPGFGVGARAQHQKFQLMRNANLLENDGKRLLFFSFFPDFSDIWQRKTSPGMKGSISMAAVITWLLTFLQLNQTAVRCDTATILQFSALSALHCLQQNRESHNMLLPWMLLVTESWAIN